MIIVQNSFSNMFDKNSATRASL